MGRVTTEALVEHLGDLYDVSRGRMPDEDVRRVVVSNALVATGAVMFSMPSSLVARLGLREVAKRRVKTSAGLSETPQYEAVKLTVKGRSCLVEVLEAPEEVPVLIGQLPLEWMDLVVDPVGQALIVNPKHGGEHIIGMY